MVINDCEKSKLGKVKDYAVGLGVGLNLLSLTQTGCSGQNVVDNETLRYTQRISNELGIEEEYVEESIEGWTEEWLRSTGTWREGDGKYLVRTGSTGYYGIDAEDVDEYEEKVSDYIAKYLAKSLIDAGRSEDITERLLGERIKTWSGTYVEKAVDEDANTIADGLFKAVSRDDYRESDERISYPGQ